MDIKFLYTSSTTTRQVGVSANIPTITITMWDELNVDLPGLTKGFADLGKLLGTEIPYGKVISALNVEELVTLANTQLQGV